MTGFGRSLSHWNSGLLLGFVAMPALTAPKPFDPGKDVRISFSHGFLVLEIPEEVHLKQRLFKVEARSQPGAVVPGELPPASGKDELGDPIWRGTVRVRLLVRGVKGAMALCVTYQPCSEGAGSLCYRPQHRILVVDPADFE